MTRSTPALDPARWQRVQAVFEQLAADPPPDPHEALCEWFPAPADHDLRALVLAMLAADAGEESAALATTAALLRAALAESSSATAICTRLRRPVLVDKPA